MGKVFRDDIESDFADYSVKIQLLYSNVVDSIRRFSKCLDDESSKNNNIEIEDENEIYNLNADLFDSMTLLGNNLKNASFYNSLLILAYSYFDFGINEYCSFLDKYKIQGKKLMKYKELGINRSKVFLLKSYKIDLEKFKDWGVLNNYRKIRNLIVHHNSNIIRNPNKYIEDQRDYKLLSSMKDIEITSAGYIFIEKIDHIFNLLNISANIINDIILKTRSLSSR